MSQALKRSATHAGSWYSGDATTLSNELDTWLSNVPSSVDGKQIPQRGGRVIIAPSVSLLYSYCSLSHLLQACRIFLLGTQRRMGL